MPSKIPSHATLKLYHGYGHTHNLVLYGHVLANSLTKRRYTNNILYNIIRVCKLFLVKPIANATVQLQWNEQLFTSETEADGFFKFEWVSDRSVPAGWHPVTVNLLDDQQKILSTAEGQVNVPHITQYAFISDIDDTVMVSYSATIFRRLRALFTKNPRTRKAFNDVVKHYQALAFSHTRPEVPNPFMYVSSSEWNLYDDLVDFFNDKGLPNGIFLLSQLKKWYQLIKTGKTKHEAKLIKVYRILEAFPSQRFILFGDSSQADPFIYEAIAKKHSAQIHAVYIRNISTKKENATRALLATIESYGVHTCFFKDDAEAIQYSKKIGLI